MFNYNLDFIGALFHSKETDSNMCFILFNSFNCELIFISLMSNEILNLPMNYYKPGVEIKVLSK